MKKLTLCAVLLAALTCKTFAENGEKDMVAGGANLSGGLSFPFLPGLAFEYERMLDDRFSLGAEIGSSMTIVPYAELRGRWYPSSSIFFTGLGLGVWNIIASPFLLPTSFMVSPQIGWKIDIGKPGGWVLLPTFTERVMFAYNDMHLWGFITDIALKVGYQF